MRPKSLGFTGTRYDPTPNQLEQLQQVFRILQFDVFHHGDCVGADTAAHFIVTELGKEIWIHPSNLGKFQGNNTTYLGRRLSPKDPLDRNHDIVDVSSMIVACPDSKIEALRSGTWATVRYARKKLKPILFVYPDGTLNLELN